MWANLTVVIVDDDECVEFNRLFQNYEYTVVSVTYYQANRTPKDLFGSSSQAARIINLLL